MIGPQVMPESTDHTPGAPASAQYVYEARHVSKQYGAIQALADVELAIAPGEVRAVVGENGAGKSTLMKIMAGAETADTGETFLDGKAVSWRNVAEANTAGIAIVFQELNLFPDLDVLANLFAPTFDSRFGIVSRAHMARRAEPVLAEIGLHCRLTSPLGSLSLAEQQLVEIARALILAAKVLILDEPNSALSAAESDRLFEVVRRLRDRGMGVVYVSHRLEEVMAIADGITVLRDGRVVLNTEVPTSEAGLAPTLREVVHAMSGSVQRRGRSTATGARVRSASDKLPATIEFDRVTVGDRLKDVSFALQAGEVVGLAGLEGAGHTAVGDCLFGQARPQAGAVRLLDGRGLPRSVHEAVSEGVARVPADRRTDGLMLRQSVTDNLALVSEGVLVRSGEWLPWRRIAQRSREILDQLNIKDQSPSSPAGSLSGGTQQKVLLAKWLEIDPSVLVLDDPTRGVDVGTKDEIYEMIRGLADAGRVVLFSTTELPEYTAVCDRVLIFYRGELRGELRGQALTTHNLLSAINTGQIADHVRGAAGTVMS
jgi:ABC-type sugar transport system ATPase subunit